jgi:hypothetical protein
MDTVIQVGASISCPHGGQVKITASNKRVTVQGVALAVFSDSTTVSGCSFQVPGPKPQPCTIVQWLVPAGRVRAAGTQVLIKSSSGLCKSAEQIPQGSPSVSSTQRRASAT